MPKSRDIPMGNPDHDRSGADVDEAVAKAEAGSQVEGLHTPSGPGESGNSRLEQMRDVEQHRVDGSSPGTVTPPPSEHRRR